MAPVLQSTSNFTVLGMLAGTDVVVKSVLALLVLASVATWTVWIAKTRELRRACRALQSDVGLLERSQSLQGLAPLNGAAAVALTGGVRAEMARAGDLRVPACADGLKERASVRLLSMETELARRMTRGINLVASVGSTAPFVGLFGTVWGIMDSFIGISRSQATNLVVVAPGIAEALLTTAMGLAAAVPAVLIYNGFTRSITGYRALLADASHALASLLSLDVERAQAPAGLPAQEAARGV
ncbi:MAG TPA: tonB-system energizer ExbB [Steroidobacteraceae bacterium]|nr:tonB-system energizer ExbB [Steroidobacteraceae bacterium]